MSKTTRVYFGMLHVVSFQMVLELIPNPGVGSIMFGPLGGVYPFDPTISWESTRKLYLHEECLCHIPHPIKEKVHGII